MNRLHQINILLLITFFVLSVCITGQTKSRPRVSNSITGVYAGFSLPMMTVNGDMQTYMRTFYFRENGTYATQLDEPDWQTRIDGNYRIIGNKLIIQSNLAGDSPSEIEIKENGGFLFYNGASLMKLHAVSSIPAVIVKNDSGASSGGMGTNNIFVAVSSSDLYNFDGGGNFSHNSSSASVISGADVGGGKSRDNNGGGTYTIKDGLLTLYYSNGKVVRKSFFYSESGGDRTALIDGSFHFETDESKKRQPNSISRTISSTNISKSKNLQTKTINGIYAGTSTPNINPFNSLTISFDTYSFYFRQNGTYTNKLGEPDWQTRVDGTYRISGSKVFIQSNSDGDKPEEIEIVENRFLYYRKSILTKLEITNNIPAVVVENKTASGSGGQIEGTVYVGNFSNTVYNFDGKGNFSNSRESSTVISGADIGGGVSGAGGGLGTYTLRDGLLTLKYQDGRVIKKSFFYREDKEGVGTALINGSFYFEPDELNTKPTNSMQKKTPTPIKSSANSGVIISLNGAYAGSSIPLLFPGGGSSSATYRYYFRPNGTYTTELDKPDWQTRIDGNYKITKGKVTLIPNQVGEKPFEMDIEEEGASLVYSGNTLFKLNVMNNIPAVLVENSGGASSGGNGTGTTFVGVSFSGVYNFDGKGRFSNNASSSSVISGANVGGGSSKESGGFGTYTINDSLLTLNYNDGKIEKKSFFYVEFSHGGTALIDGILYYEPDDAEQSQTNNPENLPNNPQNTNPIVTNNPLPKNSEVAQQGLSILKKANYAHGGANLDNLETMRLIGKGSGLDIVILVDVKNQRIRQEIRKKGVLLQIEQFDGKDNWQFADGKKSKLHEVREIELLKSLKTGFWALQSQSMSNIEFLTVDVNNQTNLKSLMLLIDGKKHGMIFDADNRLVAELSADDGILKTDYSSDFRIVKGVLLPFKSRFVEGTKSVEIKYSIIEVNPTLTTINWDAPQ